jgi:transposase InsO family protein
MPWQEVSSVSQRREFVMLASQPGANIRALCRRYRISPTTGYKWLDRSRDPAESFVDRSHVPSHQPRRTSPAMEALVLEVREEHPWGGRKIGRRLKNLGHCDVPSPSTITAILKRNGRLESKPEGGPWQRFEREAPNELWQMDFKGHFALTAGRCHPLTVIDDCSRFALGLQACGDETTETVKGRLSAVFKRYGMPASILSDNGPPWGGRDNNSDYIAYTELAVWLIRLGIALHHGRPLHPQTQGKDERFHRTLKAEVLDRQGFTDLDHCQRAFDHWRDVYNCKRPHDALELDVPAQHYQVSTRTFPKELPPIEYGDPLVRKVQGKGEISFKGREWFVGKAFAGYPVAVRPTEQDGKLDVFFCHQRVTTIDLANPR